MWLLKQFLAGTVEEAVKARETLTNYATLHDGGPLKSYSAIIQLLRKRCTMDENIATLYAEVRSLRQGLITRAEYAQELWTKAPSCGSVYDKNPLRHDLWKKKPTQMKGLSDIGGLITDMHSLEDTSQRAESLLDLQRRRPQHL